jgi:hypothetical protein
VVHAREADEETYEILAGHERAARPGWPPDQPLGSCTAAGDLALAVRYIETGFVISYRRHVHLSQC